MIALCLRSKIEKVPRGIRGEEEERKHKRLSMHSTHGAFSRSIKFTVKKALFLH